MGEPDKDIFVFCVVLGPGDMFAIGRIEDEKKKIPNIFWTN